MFQEIKAKTNRPKIPAWYLQSRFGMFYHWGMRSVAGGSSDAAFWKPFGIATVEEFEQAAGDPRAVARNLVTLTKRMGAGYLTYTMLHSGDRHLVKYPTAVKGFLWRSRHDYAGALIDACRNEGIRFVAYLPGGGLEHWNTRGGPYLGGISSDAEATAKYQLYIKALLCEMRERYGDGIDGFWIDGTISSPEVAFFKEIFPSAIVIVNNETTFRFPGMDVSTTEFLPATPNPSYNRPSALAWPLEKWCEHTQVPRSDYNEDIPTCNDWFYSGKPSSPDNPYIMDPAHLVRQMVSSLGQRRRWNFQLGLGPRVDGTAPEEFIPMVENMESFMAWARESIVGTQGGEDAPIHQGWANSGGFVSITKPVNNLYTLYIHVTTSPAAAKLKLQHDWVDVESVTDLRTGAPVPFEYHGSVDILCSDWQDTVRYGDKVFRVCLKRQG